jgi:hypothetical protein
MADRYQDRSFAASDDYDRDTGSRASANPEGDPLAELARLIGQADPLGSRPISRANLPLQPQARPLDREPSYDSYAEAPEPEEAPPGPPSWMQRAVRQEAPPPPPEDDYLPAVHPLHRYAAAHPPAEPDYDPEQLFADSGHEPDLSRYDEALYGGLDSAAQPSQHGQGYADDSYGYEDDQSFEAAQEPRRRGGGLVTVAAVLALAVFGVGGALAYRTYTGAARNGEPPIIRADAGPTKVIPATADSATKVPDRMATGDGSEKIVSREETPLDPSKANPRVVFPPLTPNGSVPLPSTVVPGATPPPAASANGTFSNNEPHRIKTLSVRGDPADAGTPATAAPPAKPAPRAAATTPRPSGAANANGPLSLSPQADTAAAPEPAVRMAATNPNPVPIAPSAGGAGGNYLVQVSSQRSEADAQASFKALQGKFPSVLGSRPSVIKRADLGDKGVYYRAMVGPFSSYDEASQFCGSLKSAGGQCVAQRN